MSEPSAAKPTSAEPAHLAGVDEPADLGILFVHGIGNQTQGETLTQMAEPLIAWIRQWLRTEEPADSLIASSAVSAALRPPLLDSATPAHARVLLGASQPEGSGPVRSERWLLAEAWWAPQVLAPPLGGFAAWLLTCAPWVGLFHFSQLWLTHDRKRWQRALIMVLVTPLWLLWSLAVSAVLVVLYPLALIPVGRFRAVFYAALRGLSGIIGDAYVKIRHPLQRRAMEDATIEAMRWLAPRCRRLVVIAHSQGAAIAHGALQRDETPHAHLFVTVGAGMAKLSALRFFQEQSGSDRLAAVLAPVFALGAVVVALRLRQSGVDTTSVWWPPATLGLFALSFVMSAWISVARALADLKRPSLSVALRPDRVGRWCDIVASHDPVPAGNITQFFDLPAVHATRVEVLGSAFKDHTSYWSAGTAFMPVLVTELTSCSGSGVVVVNPSDRRFAEASRILHRDLQLLRATSWLDSLAVALPLVLARDRVVEGVNTFRRFLRGDASAPFAFVDSWLGTVAAWLQWLTPVDGATADRVVNWCTAAALLGLLWFVWRRVLFALWNAWSANRTSDVFRRVDGAHLPSPGTPSARLVSHTTPIVVNGLLLVVAAAPIALALLWISAPDRVNEAGLYRVIGLVPVVMFVVMMAMVVAGVAADGVAGVRRSLSDPAVWQPRWPNVQAAARNVRNALFALALVLALISTIFDSAAAAAAPVMGAGLYLLALVPMLDRAWRLMSEVRPSLRTALMLLPLLIGVALSWALRNQGSVGALVSAAVLVSLLGAAILCAILHLVLGRLRVAHVRDGA